MQVLLLHGKDRIFTCGTNAYEPNCTWRQADDLSVIHETTGGRGICPYSPSHNTTALVSASGELYAATVVDFLARDPAISRSFSAANLRTEQRNSKWLNGNLS